MNRRTFKVLNFFAFNLLFFALYLNFIHKDKDISPLIPATDAVTSHTPATIVDNAEQYTKKALAQSSESQQAAHTN